MKLKAKTIKNLRQKYGTWALVTGASSGIGREIASKLAEAGFNLVVSGRRENELNLLASHFFDFYHVQVIPIVGDLTSEADVNFLLHKSSHLPIGIAILNAGFGTSGKFIDSDIETELNLIDLNCKSVLAMTHYFAKKMANESRQGAIVLLSSMVAFQGVPNAANYSASKAYIQSLGEALNRELKPLDIDLLCAVPGPVRSGFSTRANMKMGMALQPQDVAVPIIRAIGKKDSVLPGWLTNFLVYSLSLLPRWAKVRVMEKVMYGFTKHQEKAL